MKYFFLTVLLLSVRSLCAQDKEQVNNSSIAFTVEEKDLLPENVAYDPVQDAFYIGSTRKGKILRVKDGKTEEFISAKKNGLWMVVGMKTDPARRLLWVCSSGGNNLEGYRNRDEVEGREAGIFKFNLDNGEFISKYTLEKKGEIHFFNDLVVANNGDLYATHMFKDHAIYRIANNAERLERFVESPLIKYPNGITISDNQSILFIAHAEGIARIDIPTKKITDLKMPDNVSARHGSSIDGLYYYRWSLIGIQPGRKTVNCYLINETGDGIKEVRVIEKNHPMMDHPTTGVMVGSALHYVANSQFERISDEGVLVPMEQLYQPVILKVDIAPIRNKKEE